MIEGGTGQPDLTTDPPGGSRGLPCVTGARSGMDLLRRMIEAGDATPDQLQKNLSFAIGLRDDPNINERTRIKAAELVSVILRHIADKAVDLDRMQRLEAGERTGDEASVTIIVQRAEPVEGGG